MGETPAEAMKKARDSFGEDAQVVETKEVRKKTLNQAGLYEMTVMVDEDVATQNTTDSQNIVQNSVQQRLEEIAQRQLAKKREEKEQTMRDAQRDIGWGYQIRSYVLQPYKMVKDLRTEVETSDCKAVLDGDIDIFLSAALAGKVGTN